MVARKSEMLWTAIILCVALALQAQPAAAKNNPPGCKNPGAAVHNPNCSGGDGIHVPITPVLPPIPIQTIPITPTVPPLQNVNVPRPITPTVRPRPDTLTPTVRPNPDTLTPSVRPTPDTLTPTVRPAPDTLTPAVDPLQPAGAETGTPPVTKTDARGPAAMPSADGNCPSGSGASNGVPCSANGTTPAGGPAGTFVFELNERNAAERSVLSAYSPEIISKDGAGSAATVNGDEAESYGSILVHVQRSTGDPTYATHVPPKPGDNYVPGYRAYLISDTGHVSKCVLSGMGRRSVVNQNGHTLTYGYSQTYSLRSATVANLPANRRKASQCLVSIQE